MAVNTVRTQALNVSTSFAQAGVVFNDATRLLEGGLWQNVQTDQAPYLGLYTADIKAVTADLAAVPKGQFTCTTLATVQAIQADLATLLNATPASVNGGGTFGSVAAADKALHDAQLDIISKVQGNTQLAALAVSGSHTGF